MDATTPSPAVTPPPAAAGEDHRVTPLMEQYIEIKAANPDCLLFYRMGDFYELFFEDAEVAVRALGIVLTKRGKHRGRDIPMCGVPIERADEYLHRLIALGHRVAVCEQTRGPRGGAESAAPRAWCGATWCGSSRPARSPRIRCSTPAQQLSASPSRARKPSADGESRFALGLARHFDRRIPHRRMRPRGSAGRDRAARAGRNHRLRRALRRRRTRAAVAHAAGGDAARRATCSTAPPPSAGSPPISRWRPRDAFGALSRLELTAAAACVTYVERTQLGKRPPLSPPAREARRRDARDRRRDARPISS